MNLICAVCHKVAKFRVDIHIVPINQPEIPEHQERILLCEEHIKDPGPAFGWDYQTLLWISIQPHQLKVLE